MSNYHLWIKLLATLLLVLGFSAGLSQGEDYAFLAETRSLENYQLDLFDLQSGFVQSIHNVNSISDLSRFSLSPDGTRAINFNSLQTNPNVRILRIWENDTQDIAVLEGLDQPNVWASDSHHLTVGISQRYYQSEHSTSRDLGVLDVNSGDLTVLTVDEYVVTAAWSSDGSQILYSTQTATADQQKYQVDIRLIALNDRSDIPETVYSYTTGEEAYPELQWLPDGQHVAVSLSSQELVVIRLEDGEIILEYAPPAGELSWWQMCWSPTQNLFIATYVGQYELVSIDDTALSAAFVGELNLDQSPDSPRPCDWSADGQRLALSFSGDTQPFVRVVDFENETLQDIYVDQELYQLHPYWSPDGMMLAIDAAFPETTSSNGLYIYDVSDVTQPEQTLYLAAYDFFDWIDVPS